MNKFRKFRSKDDSKILLISGLQPVYGRPEVNSLFFFLHVFSGSDLSST